MEPTLTLVCSGGGGPVSSGGVLVPRRRIQWHPRPRHLARSHSPVAPVRCMGLQQAQQEQPTSREKWKRDPDEQKTRLPSEWKERLQ